MIADYILPAANHLWQSTLFGIAVWVMSAMLRKNRAAIRHRLWLAASLKFLVPFSLLVTVGSHFQWEAKSESQPVPVSMIVSTITRPFSASGPSRVPPTITTAPPVSRFPDVLLEGWACGFVVSLFLWLIRWRQVRRVVRMAKLSNVTGPIPVMYCSERFEPGVFGIVTPVLLLPESITLQLSPDQLETVLAHEWCHVERRDNLVMAAHMIVEALFWFHPLVWFIRLRLIEEQERACDEEVLRVGCEPAAYAESLLKICDFYVESPSACAFGASGSDLKKRVGRIMRNYIGENLNGWRKLILAAASLVALATPVLLGILNATPQNHTRPANTPRWEVTAIKPCAPSTAGPGPGQRGGGAPGGGPPLSFSQDRMTLNCQNVRSLIQSAYLQYANGVDVAGRPGSLFKEEALATVAVRTTPIEGGPTWMDSERYVIEAKAESVAERGMMRGPMLQNLLEDRFKLRVHWETREVPLYALTVAKGGPKLKAFKEGSCTPYPAPDLTVPPVPPPPLEPGLMYCAFAGGLMGPTAVSVVINADGLTIDEFSKLFLSGLGTKGVRIIDRTGLTGRFDFHLEYALDEADRQRFAANSGRSVSDFDSSPLLFDALQEQLGLKLESTKGPGEILVIDQLERPSPN